MMNVTLRHDLFHEYLRMTNTKMIVPRVFLKWLEPRKNDPKFGPLWERYFRKSDTEAAFLYRMDLVRSDVSKFKITVIVPPASKPVSVSPLVTRQPVKTATVPEFISIESGRAIGGGGYSQVDSNVQPALWNEHLRQGGKRLEEWLERYGDAITGEGIDLIPVQKLLATLKKY